MALGDVRFYDVGGKSNVPVWKFLTKANTTAIKAGEPVVVAQALSVFGAYPVVLTDGLPIRNTDYFLGIAASTSSHTSSADGTVDVYLDLPGTVYACKAKTAAQIDTQAEVDSTVFYRIPFDLTTSTYTADLANATTAGLTVIGGDPTTSTVFFVCQDGASWRHSVS